MKIPAILLITALQIDVATFPPPAEVSIIHILTVVGKHVMMRNPSTNAGGIALGMTLFKNDFIGTPIKNGHTTKSTN